ncbi:MAG TPA: FKBP-type peptidyl-prolyl cis-trans isomerase [Arthrobacter sp.]|nr:FKBP-type peptidyl-prolyl cis-trans isomerase [Arthrobacter sp.]
MRFLVALAGIAATLMVACGYPDPAAGQGSAATTAQTTPTPVAGADDFNEGAGKPVITLPDGLKYINLRVGDGAVATASSTVRVHYTGWLASGQKFDSSRDRGQPFDVPLGQGQVIPGWDEGIPGMKVGGRRKLIIPPALAYKDQGYPPTIPPNATLTFTVELLAVTAGPSPSPSSSPSPKPTG